MSQTEVIKAARKLTWDKASGIDAIPAQFWKAICREGTPACQWARELCQRWLDEGAVPEAWPAARVAAIFKKGDVSSCENYRPISLLPIGYKLYAMVLLNRLKAGGAEDRIWHTQFGFKSKRGTVDALFLARRMIDEAWATRYGSLIMLALDWAKAFDSISPDALLTALRRFGVPSQIFDSIRAIYTGRRFIVNDVGHASLEHPQKFGICQGCPLSPFLLSMLMTMLMHVARRRVAARGIVLHPDIVAHDILYADDTVVVDTSGENVEQYMACIAEAGSKYGLSFNFSKLEAMPVWCVTAISNSDGSPVKDVTSMVYLGSLLCGDGTIGSELCLRIGAATSEFRTLSRIWSHAKINKKRKVEIYRACVESKLLYSLHVAWLSIPERRRLDAFQAKCLRKLVGIRHSYLSRVRNQHVLETAKCRKLSALLLERHLRNLACRPDNDNTRSCIFVPGSSKFKDISAPKRQGRPRNCWRTAVISRPF